MAKAEADFQVSLSRLTLQERREANQAALAKLNKEDQLRIGRMANQLLDAVRSHSNGQFAPDGALEVIAGLGMFLNRRL